MGCIQDFLCSWILHWGYVIIIMTMIIMIIIIIIIITLGIIIISDIEFYCEISTVVSCVITIAGFLQLELLTGIHTFIST